MISGRLLRAATGRARPLMLPALLGLALVAGGCSESKAAAQGKPAAAAPSGSATAAASETCGKTGLPDCPLQSWMKSTVQAYLRANDTNRLATALEQLAEKAPAGYDGWRESALGAAKAARSGDLAATKAACKQCHDQHRSRFRGELRSTVLF